MKRVVQAALGTLMLVCVSSAYAANINGEIHFNGAATNTGTSLVVNGTPTVNGGPTTFDFVGATLNSFIGTLNYTSGGAQTVWEVATTALGAVELVLSNITVEFNGGIGGALVLSGVGSFQGVGIDTTSATWNLSTSGNTAEISFSTFAATPIPAAVWLFVTAVMGAFGYRKIKGTGSQAAA